MNTRNVVILVAILAAMATAACGDGNIPPTEPVVVNAVPESTDCEERREACSDLVQASLDACNGRADRAALSTCIGEAVTCFNTADAAFAQCNEAEEICRENTPMEIRDCNRVCRGSFTTAEAACYRTRTETVQEVCDATFDGCTAPAEEALPTCRGDAQIANLSCTSEARAARTACENDCSEQACLDDCTNQYEIAFVRCSESQELDNLACQEAYDDAWRACEVERQNCADEAQLVQLLCMEGVSNDAEDCYFHCDPGSSRRCDMDCYETYNAEAGACFTAEWDCYARESNEGSSACETDAQTKTDECFAQEVACEAASQPLDQ